METQDELRKQIMEWLKHKDFALGIKILKSQRPRMAIGFCGRPATYADKLEYELKKLIGIDRISLLSAAMDEDRRAITASPVPANPAVALPKKEKAPQKQAPQPQPVEDQPQPPPPPAPQPEEQSYTLRMPQKPTDTIPPEIEMVVREHSRLFQLRSQLAEQRLKLGQSNAPNIAKQRKTISEAIKIYSERIEQLFKAHQNYLHENKIPDISQLIPGRVTCNAEDLETPREQLVEERKKLLMANRRDRMLLTYNSTKKSTQPNPMPKGARRTSIEKRMAERTIRVKEIDMALRNK